MSTSEGRGGWGKGDVVGGKGGRVEEERGRGRGGKGVWYRRWKGMDEVRRYMSIGGWDGWCG